MKTVVCLGAIAAATTVAAAADVTYNAGLAGYGASLDGIVGDGISNANMVVATEGDIQIGMKAHARFVGDLATNGVGDTYFAQAGASTPTLGSPTPATWNFTLAMDFDTQTLGDFQINLLIDFDPSAAQDFFNLDITSLVNSGDQSLNSLSTFGLSENLGFSYWSTVFGEDFDPNAAGEYDFVLEVREAGELVSSSAMTVVVVPLPPAAFAGLGLLGVIAGVRAARRR